MDTLKTQKSIYSFCWQWFVPSDSTLCTAIPCPFKFAYFSKTKIAPSAGLEAPSNLLTVPKTKTAPCLEDMVLILSGLQVSTTSVRFKNRFKQAAPRVPQKTSQRVLLFQAIQHIFDQLHRILKAQNPLWKCPKMTEILHHTPIKWSRSWNFLGVSGYLKRVFGVLLAIAAKLLCKLTNLFQVTA